MGHPAESAITETRNRLIQAAREAFMEEGYRASVDSIASRAGVAKQTLYNHFPSKDELFSESAGQVSDAIVVSLDGQTDDVRATLIRFGTTFRQKVLGAEGLAMFRTLMAEAVRFPTLAQAFFAKGPEQTTARLANFLGRAMAASQLRQDDPRFAAEMLIGMLKNIEHFRHISGNTELSEPHEKARIEQITDCFLRAYAPNH
ncbi:putative TetR-type transcriptional regulator [Sulfuricella denitrificans skB26]|uniref:Putative TetR-type transcriptional regulator n=1 Tax=Sulfuricella denitrificans (strain DSM 22764 / NBRC 105220 / skB26) TaxID=1163617 RepID=S6AAA2_SULDS|nr:TetR/AcrR family transcriptional regulator [Sulfuricella denitrificans]BAN35505.1 putative TetR-type transcriptional regulator [Sulfuricella denitrificans skB26]